MAERIFYYFVYNTVTKKRELHTTDQWSGDIGDYFAGDEYLIIEDYTEEVEEFEQTTDIDLSEYIPF